MCLIIKRLAKMSFNHSFGRTHSWRLWKLIYSYLQNISSPRLQKINDTPNQLHKIYIHDIYTGYISRVPAGCCDKQILISLACPACNPQSTHAPPPRQWGCQRTHASTSVLLMSTGVFLLIVAGKCDWRSRSLKKNWLKLHSLVGWKIRLASLLGCVSYFADQLTDDTPYFSGASTINSTPDGDRWARVLGGRIGWLSEPLHLVDADCCQGLSAIGRALVHENWKKMWLPQKQEKIPPHRKYTTKATAARRLRPPRDGM